MSKLRKFFARLMSGQCDADVAFTERIRGDHHIYSRDGIAEIINLQPLGTQAKPYQVKQVRNLIQKYHLKLQD